MGKKMKNGLSDYSDDFLQFVLDTSCNFWQVIRTLKIAVVGTSYQLIEKEIKDRKLDISQFEKNKKISKYINKEILSQEDIFVKNSPVYNVKDYLVKFNIKDITKCERCGISEWMGEPITIEIHHLDGDHFNNEPSNLACLCPNCHSQTENYSGKSSKNNKKIPESIMKKEFICVDCGTKIYGTNSRCKNCYYKYLINNKTISKRNLIKWLGQGKNVKDISDIVGCDENIVYRDCKKYGLLKNLEDNNGLNCNEQKKKLEKWEYIKKPRFLSQYTDEEFRDILKKEIREKSFMSLGKKYGVRDNTIRKWCKRLGLPNRKSEINSYSDEEWEKI